MADNINDTQKIVDIEGNTIANVNPTIIETTKLPINIIGEDVSELANPINENFIKTTQNFFGAEAPNNPLIGQIWFNKNDMCTYRWLGDNWVQVDRDSTFDCFLYIKHDITETEFVIDEAVFNFTIDNIKLYNQDMQDIKFVIDPFDSKKIILKEMNVTSLYIMVFHPKDRITNPFINKKVEIFTESGQTQFDIESFLTGTDINTLSVDLNGVMMKNNEFSVTNNILTIDGMIYRVRLNDKLTVWRHGGSHEAYYSNLHVVSDSRKDFLRIPKFFKSVMNLELFDEDNKIIVNPIEVTELDDYYHFEFLDKKLISTDVKIRII